MSVPRRSSCQGSTAVCSRKVTWPAPSALGVRRCGRTTSGLLYAEATRSKTGWSLFFTNKTHSTSHFQLKVADAKQSSRSRQLQADKICGSSSEETRQFCSWSGRFGGCLLEFSFQV